MGELLNEGLRQKTTPEGIETIRTFAVLTEMEPEKLEALGVRSLI